MADLSVTFGGLALENPVLADVQARDLAPSGLGRLANAGAAAVVLPTVEAFAAHGRAGADEVTVNNRTDGSIRDIHATIERLDADEYLAKMAELAVAATVPLIAPVSSSRSNRWLRRAADLAAAGVQMVELRPFDGDAAYRLKRNDAERMALRATAQVADRLPIPVIVRLPPFAPGLHALVHSLGDAGARGVVLAPPPWLAAIRADKRTVVEDLSDEGVANAAVWTSVSAARILYRRVTAHLGVVVLPVSQDAAVSAVLAGATVCLVPVSDAGNRSQAEIGHTVETIRTWMDRRRAGTLFDVRGTLSESRLTSSLEPGPR